MPVPNSMADLSTLASSNFPTGTESIGNGLDNYLRAGFAILRSTNAISSATIASASTTDIGLSDGEAVTVTGAATINSFGNGFPGCIREVTFTGACVLVASSGIVIPGSTSITTAAGDRIILRCTAPAIWALVAGTVGGAFRANSLSDATGNIRTGTGGLDSRLPISGGTMTGQLGILGTSGFGILWRDSANTVNRFYANNDNFSLRINSLSDAQAYDGTILTLSRTSLDVLAGGNFTAVGNITSNSDERLKENWAEISADLVDRLAGVKAGDYDRIDTGKRQTGVGAQSIEEVMPWVVSESEGVKSVAYGNAALVGVVALCRRLKALEAYAGVA